MLILLCFCNRFITAASDGDVDAVKAYLKEGLDVNSQDWDKLTALIAAASQGHMSVVKLLLEKVRPYKREIGKMTQGRNSSLWGYMFLWVNVC